MNNSNKENFIEFENYLKEATIVSKKSVDFIRGYAACTDKGIVKNFNEDRVCIIQNLAKSSSRPGAEAWPRCSFFGIYDGHGGSECSSFLQENLHGFIVSDEAFPSQPEVALTNGFRAAETAFLATTQNNSGSCANVVLIIGNKVYCANVGDSRSLLSMGDSVLRLSRDHKPRDKLENQRIKQAGGTIYQSKRNVTGFGGEVFTHYGPMRVNPGRLSVTRAFGNIQAKDPNLRGNPECIISRPEIFVKTLDDTCDFIFIASDGVYDRLQDVNIASSVLAATGGCKGSVHDACGDAARRVLADAMRMRTSDNISSIVICLTGLEKKIPS